MTKLYTPAGGLILRGDEAVAELMRQRQERRHRRRHERDVRHLRRMGLRPIAGATQRGYGSSTEGAVSLAAATAKTILGVRAGATFNVQLKQFSIGFDGVTASAVPVLWEIVEATYASNPPGTNSTSTTIDQRYGRALANGMTAAKSWTSEPTVLTPHDENLLTPNGGLLVVQYPPGQEPDAAALNDGWAIRLNAPAIVNCRATLMFEPC